MWLTYTILNNITLRNPDITEEQVQEAAKQIGIHDFIESLPNGYNYNVKERGSMLSSGQRQLISFLRAYVTNPSILILDEATSSLDIVMSEQSKYTNEETNLNVELSILESMDTYLSEALHLKNNA